jgi:hypothetical protein
MKITVINLTTEAVSTSETLPNSYQTAWRSITDIFTPAAVETKTSAPST